MAQSSGGADMTLGPANADLSAKQYTFCELNTSGLVITSTAGSRALGVQQNKPKAGEGVAVRLEGATSKLQVDGNVAAIAIGDALKSDANGQGIKTTTDGDEVGAFALQASTAAGDVIEALVVNRQR